MWGGRLFCIDANSRAESNWTLSLISLTLSKGTSLPHVPLKEERDSQLHGEHNTFHLLLAHHAPWALAGWRFDTGAVLLAAAPLVPCLQDLGVGASPPNRRSEKPQMKPFQLVSQTRVHTAPQDVV